jgi:putative transcriptional regulator
MQNKIRELRQSHGISQAKLGDMLNVSRQTINSLESGRYNPSITLAFKLANVFNMQIEDIFIYKEKEND